jgi:hypothetical protein
MFLVDPFSLIVDSLPKYDLTVHTARSHEMKFRNGNHSHDHALMYFVLWIVTVIQSFFCVSLEIPQ